MPHGKGRGIAVAEAFKTYVAQVAEVSVDAAGRIKIDRVVCAVDCGTPINPDIITAQMEGGIGFGLGAVLYGAITLKDGHIEQSNFNDYRVLRMNEMPKVEGAHRAIDAGADGRRRARGRARGASGRQCHLCGNRQAHPCAAIRKRRRRITRAFCRWNAPMHTLRKGEVPSIESTVGHRLRIAAVAAYGVCALHAVFGPEPTDFAGGKRVPASAYRDADPTGVPAELKSASLTERGEYLTRAADCVVCHTSEGGC